MRLVLIAIATSLLVATSAGAVNKSNRGQCRQIAKQLNVHAASVERAKAQGNVLWAQNTLQYMARLDDRRARLCPDLYPQGSSRAQAMVQMAEFLKTAGRTALSLLTFGAF